MDMTPCLDDIDPDFEYKNSNDSHQWILRYPESLRPDPQTLKISSKNETFVEHEILRQGAKGKRKKLMEAFYRKVISEEVLADFENEEIIIEDYVTDYMERFKNPDDMPLPGEELSKNEKLKMENEPDSEATELCKETKLEEEMRRRLYHSLTVPVLVKSVWWKAFDWSRFRQEGPNWSIVQLKSKYPLYFSSPVTFFSHLTGRSNFRKNPTITKPPDLNYDNIEY